MTSANADLSVMKLAASFVNDVEAISTDLIEFFSLKYSQEDSRVTDPTLRWLDFRLRYIDPFQRPVVFSNQFPKQNLPADTLAALENLVTLIEKGADINPYQGRGLILRHDTSRERKDSRTDLLLADWGIHHLHLSNTPIPKDQYFSLPGDYLAFCLIGSNVVAFIDILSHPDKEGFANPNLVTIIHENWPDFLEPFRLKHVMPGEGFKTQSEIHRLRAVGVQPPLIIGDSAYFAPGGGINMAATSNRVMFAYDKLVHCLKELAKLVCDPNGQFYTDEIRSQGNPKFSIVMTLRGLCVYEENSNRAVLLPTSRIGIPQTIFEAIHDLVFPVWVCKAVGEKLPI